MDEVQAGLALRSALARLTVFEYQDFIASGAVELTVPGLGRVVVRLERE